MSVVRDFDSVILIWRERILHSNTNSFPVRLKCLKSFFFNFGFCIQKLPYWNVLHIEKFKFQTTCYIESFLEPRMLETVPDCLEDFKLKKKLWNPENCLCRLCKRFLPKVIFYNAPVNFLCSIFYHFYVTF